MKAVYVNGVGACLGKEIKELFYLEKLTYIDTESGKWQECSLMDKTGRLMGKIWSQNTRPDTINYCKSVVEITGRVEIYRDKYYLNISLVVPVNSKYLEEDYSSTLPETEQKRLLKRLDSLQNTVKNPPLKELLKLVYTDERKVQICYYHGGLTYHHKYHGGLLEYIVEVTDMALFMVNKCQDMRRMMFQGQPDVNLDLVCAGALLHGIGMLCEMTGAMFPTNTRRGLLLGCNTDSMVTVTLFNSHLKDKVRNMAELLHIINVAKSCGGPAKTIEALIVNEARKAVESLNAYYLLFKDYDFEHPNEPHKDVVYSRYFDSEIFRGGE